MKQLCGTGVTQHSPTCWTEFEKETAGETTEPVMPTSERFCANLGLFPLRENQECCRIWLGINCWADGLVPALPPAQPISGAGNMRDKPAEGRLAFRDTDLCRKQKACEARRSLRGGEDLGFCRGGTIKIRDYCGVGGMWGCRAVEGQGHRALQLPWMCFPPSAGRSRRRRWRKS